MKAYWRSVIHFDALVDAGMIDRKDLSLFSFAENAEEAWSQLLARGVARKEEPKNT